VNLLKAEEELQRNIMGNNVALRLDFFAAEDRSRE
jgi:hypothetical protein